MSGSVSRRLTAIRTSLGMSQAEMARFLRLPPTTYNPYEKSDKIPKIEWLVRLAEKGYNINWLLTGSGPMLIYDQNLPSDLSRTALISLASDAVVAVDEWLVEHERALSPQRKGEIVALLIEEAIEESASSPGIKKSSAARYLRLVA